MSVRLRRLQAEYERLQLLFEDHERIRIVEANGQPPDRYVIEYRVKGLVERDGELVESGLHRAEITLGPGYPREQPRCVMLTPVFHPNIDYLAICTEDIGAVGQNLDRTLVFIGEMITFQAYNLQSPRNGDAARWTAESRDRLPLENVDLMPPALTRGGPDLELALATTAATHHQVAVDGASDSAATGREPMADDVEAACMNCGADAEDPTSCARGHHVCPDCWIDCTNCAANICLVCEPRQCASCKGLFCEDCTVICKDCGDVACLAHVARCPTCRAWICTGDCAGQCRSCAEPRDRTAEGVGRGEA